MTKPCLCVDSGNLERNKLKRISNRRACDFSNIVIALRENYSDSKARDYVVEMKRVRHLSSEGTFGGNVDGGVNLVCRKSKSNYLASHGFAKRDRTRYTL